MFTPKSIRLFSAIKTLVSVPYTFGQITRKLAQLQQQCPHKLAPSNGAGEKCRSAEQDVVALPGALSPPKYSYTMVLSFLHMHSRGAQ